MLIIVFEQRLSMYLSHINILEIKAFSLRIGGYIFETVFNEEYKLFFLRWRERKYKIQL